MGLDMYLYKKSYVKNWDHMSDEEKHQITVKKNKKKVGHIKPERITYIVEEVGYWRKANAIHNWFVKHCQKGVDECQESYVNPEKIIELLNLCKQVKKDHKLAPTLLPTGSGFFFGSTDYDDWYYNDINHTIKILEDVLKENESGACSDYYYRSSW